MKLSAEGTEFYFYYSLLGNDITSEPFHNLLSPNFEPERSSVRIRSSKQVLQTFLSQEPDLEVSVSDIINFTNNLKWVVRVCSCLPRSICVVAVALWAAQMFLSLLWLLDRWIWRARQQQWKVHFYSNLPTALTRSWLLCLQTCSRLWECLLPWGERRYTQERFFYLRSERDLAVSDLAKTCD